LLTPLSISGSTMRPDEVQGFFAALASGPDAADRSMAGQCWAMPRLLKMPKKNRAGSPAKKLFDVTAHVLADGRWT
jgi:uncharacterized protein